MALATGAMSEPRISELWVYPVKGLRGVPVKEAKLGEYGLELDRCWCIVDADGCNIARNCSASQRQMPALATVEVKFSDDGSSLLLDAPGMSKTLILPVAVEAYDHEEDVIVEKAGRSTTANNEGWSFGFVKSKRHELGSQWVSEYFNREVGGKLLSGFPAKTRWWLVRSCQHLTMKDYEPCMPVVSKAKREPDYIQRFAGNSTRFADFAPLHIVSQSSAADVAVKANLEEDYPTRPCRGNIVVSGGEPWEEENWRLIDVVPSDGTSSVPISLRCIKPTPRCTVPLRDQSTGKFLFATDSLKLWKVLRKAFPRKNGDKEWGSWAGVFMGVYFGNAGRPGTLRVGDRIVVKETRPWDWHLRPWCSWLQLCTVGLVLVGTAAAIARLLPDRRPSKAAVAS